jgi:hypothetical protein
VASGQLLNACKHGFRSRHKLEAEIMIKRLAIQSPRDNRRFEDGFDFRSEQDAAVELTVIERFDSQAISYEQELVAAVIHKREGEHAPKLRQHVQAVFFPRVQDDFSIRVTPKNMPLGFESGFQVCKVVNLAVENDLDGSVLIAHGLAAGLGEINDAKAAMPQRPTVFARYAVLVRAAMRETIGHAPSQIFILPVESANAAHGVDGGACCFCQRRRISGP